MKLLDSVRYYVPSGKADYDLHVSCRSFYDYLLSFDKDHIRIEKRKTFFGPEISLYYYDDPDFGTEFVGEVWYWFGDYEKFENYRLYVDGIKRTLSNPFENFN